MNIRYSSNINVYILCRLFISTHPKHEMATFDTTTKALHVCILKYVIALFMNFSPAVGRNLVVSFKGC